MAFRPTKPRQYGDTKEVIGRLIGQTGGAKEAAFLLGMEGSTTVYAYTDPAEKTQITFDQVRRLTSADATAAAEDLSARAGGVFLPFAPVEGCLNTLTARSAKEWGEFIAAVLSGEPDAIIMRELDEVICALVDVRTHRIAPRDDAAAPDQRPNITPLKRSGAA
ncbi:conserved hypothetical protein [Hyphomicrobiales bacterium]|nr:conserved hypothetical protein [Hyphomicrobiales bacterium]CAH1663899.1 conserved hypothetical protein [Hyphomicrobiales bacterium]